jgi:hypothetical protein
VQTGNDIKEEENRKKEELKKNEEQQQAVATEKDIATPAELDEIKKQQFKPTRRVLKSALVKPRQQEDRKSPPEERVAAKVRAIEQMEKNQEAMSINGKTGKGNYYQPLLDHQEDDMIDEMLDEEERFELGLSIEEAMAIDTTTKERKKDKSNNIDVPAAQLGRYSLPGDIQAEIATRNPYKNISQQRDTATVTQNTTP